MGVTEVVAADGRRWSVRRRIAWPRWREIDIGVSPLDALDVNGFDAGPASIAFGLLLLVVGGILIVLLLPLLFFLVEVLLVVAAIGLLRGTWLIEATTSGPEPETKQWKVKGWSRSRRAVEEVASELRAGLNAAPADGEALSQNRA